MSEKKMPENLIELLNQMKEEGIPKEQYKKRIDCFLSFKAAKNAVPYSGTFELTPLCNLNCQMCYVHLSKAQIHDDLLLNVEQWKYLIRQARNLGMQKATLTGGECLTYPQFDELYLYLHSLGVDVTVLTNGILLNDKRIQFFKEHPPIAIRVTVYGSSNEAYEKVTGYRQFDTVWNNINMAKEANLPISIAITPSIFMEYDADALVEKVHSLGLEYIINSGLFEPRENTGRQELGIEASGETYIRMYKKSRILKGKECIPVSCEQVPEPKTDGLERYGIRCGAGRNGFQMNWKGEMFACVNLPLFHEEPLRDGFEVCWKRIHQKVMQMRIPAECAGCSYEYLCVCSAVHLQNGSAAHCKSDWCQHTKKLVAEGIFELPGESV